MPAEITQSTVDAVKSLTDYWLELSDALSQAMHQAIQEDANQINAAVKQLNALISASTHIATSNANQKPVSTQSLKHDLRTPMNAIKGYAEIILEDIDDTQQHELRDSFSKLLVHSEHVLNAIAQIGGDHSSQTSLSQLIAPTTHSATPAPESNVVQGHILIVDDIESNRTLLERHLVDQGHQVSCASGGIEALTMLSSQRFDLVLLDMLMPDMHGDEVLKRIKSDKNLRDLPVIVISALDEMKSVIKCIEAGAEDYLPKPFNPTLLKARIGNGLEKKRLRDETTALLKRLEGELEDAKLAQLNMVPHDFPIATLQKPYSIFGYMQPAREVGGDFYDFFHTGKEHVWFLVGDVSDKGVASGMFMARAVALLRLIPSQIYEHSEKLLLPNEVLESLNRELCNFNDEMTFVTLLLARLNHKTGELCVGNAGHAAPFVLSTTNKVLELGTHRGRPLGIRTDSSYQTSYTNMNTGESLFLYTDGITDAQNTAGQLYTEQRLQQVLRTSASTSPQEQVRNINNSITEFVDSVDQFDDITMLSLCWEGENFGIQQEYQLKNALSEIGQLSNDVRALVEGQGLSRTFYHDIAVVIDEVLSNIIEYAFADDSVHLIRVHVELNQNVLLMSFADDGIAFDPLAQTSPDLTQPLETRAIGGLGVQFVSELMDECYYERKGGENHFTVKKFINSASY